MDGSDERIGLARHDVAAGLPVERIPKTGESKRLARAQRVVIRPAVAPLVKAVRELDAAPANRAAPRRQRLGAHVDASTNPPHHWFDRIAPVVSHAQNALCRRDVIARQFGFAKLRPAKTRKRAAKSLGLGHRESSAHAGAIVRRPARGALHEHSLPPARSLWHNGTVRFSSNRRKSRVLSLACSLSRFGARRAAVDRAGPRRRATDARRVGFLHARADLGLVRLVSARRGAQRSADRPARQRRPVQRGGSQPAQCGDRRASAERKRRGRPADGDQSRAHDRRALFGIRQHLAVRSNRCQRSERGQPPTGLSRRCRRRRLDPSRDDQGCRSRHRLANRADRSEFLRRKDALGHVLERGRLQRLRRRFVQQPAVRQQRHGASHRRRGQCDRGKPRPEQV